MDFGGTQTLGPQQNRSLLGLSLVLRYNIALGHGSYS
jgi:hypothetical protein